VRARPNLREACRPIASGGRIDAEIEPYPRPACQRRAGLTRETPWHFRDLLVEGIEVENRKNWPGGSRPKVLTVSRLVNFSQVGELTIPAISSALRVTCRLPSFGPNRRRRTSFSQEGHSDEGAPGGHTPTDLYWNESSAFIIELRQLDDGTGGDGGPPVAFPSASRDFPWQRCEQQLGKEPTPSLVS
jgi:hypothetical protein